MHAQNRTRPSRRTSLRGHPGVYYRLDASGKRRYEVTYIDREDRRRWQTVDGNLAAAQAALETARGRVRRGEKIGPARLTFAEVTDSYLAAAVELRPRTREKYEGSLRLHALPHFGRVPIAKLDEDDVATLIASMRAAGYAGWTIRGTLVAVSRVFSYAVRRGLAPANPVSRLERGERPRGARREQRILGRNEIGKLLHAVPTRYQPLVATCVFTGVRLGELLGLRWADIDFPAGVIHVRGQVDNRGRYSDLPKTDAAFRAVVLMPTLAGVLRRHKAASPHSQESDYVFASTTGTPMLAENVRRRALRPAAVAAGFDPPGSPGGERRPGTRRRDQHRLGFHDLRHTFASLLIAQGANVVYVSRQLGHADPAITLKVYAHLFDAHEQADRARDLLEAAVGNLIGTEEAETPKATIVALPRG
jgi:integrase